jgi:hypothetical protein
MNRLTKVVILARNYPLIESFERPNCRKSTRAHPFTFILIQTWAHLESLIRASKEDHRKVECAQSISSAEERLTFEPPEAATASMERFCTTKIQESGVRLAQGNSSTGSIQIWKKLKKVKSEADRRYVRNTKVSFYA